MRAPDESAAARAFHQQWNGGAPIIEEAEKHRFTQAFVEQVLVPKDARWGRKSRAAGAGPISKDTVAYWLGPTVPTEPTDGLLDARDLLTSRGIDTWNSDDDPAYNNIHARWYPIAPVAISGAEPPSLQATPDRPLQATPDRQIEALLSDVEQRLRDHVDAAVGQLRADLQAALEAVPPSVAAVIHAEAEKQLSDIRAHIAATLAELPKEYELRYLGRVVGTLRPKT